MQVVTNIEKDVRDKTVLNKFFQIRSEEMKREEREDAEKNVEVLSPPVLA